ncbi:MAG: aminotransferase class I/II-fold pyridoxal phosphate-dependent enzyme [Bacillota bacterium]|nr:aminotransferase class I/II-fold pyridoxal phosphate-dependent enzyme [Bacillota bacterium]
MRLMNALGKINSERLTSFHMPGHKNGRLIGESLKPFLAYDITEIPGADNLHHSESCIEETKIAVSEYYGSKVSEILVGGSTIGMISAILGATNRGDEILINRNAHQSIYNAVELNGLKPFFIAPEFDDHLSIPIGIDAHRLRSRIEDMSAPKACVLTYPTYEGICYPIEDLIDACHDAGMIVIVDEAHGAHLKLFDGPYKSSLELGADIVIQSFHKTLPAMTQTACIHFSVSNRLSDFQFETILWHLKALQTSSPSYVLMASIDEMLGVMETKGPEYVKWLKSRIETFYKNVSGLGTLKCCNQVNQEISKIIVSIAPEYYDNEKWNCEILAEKLRNDYQIQVEYATKSMCLLMTSIANIDDDFVRLERALGQIDVATGKSVNPLDPQTHIPLGMVYESISDPSVQVFKANEARNMTRIKVPVKECVGKLAGEYVIPYPPGIPVIVPGERITLESLRLIPETMKEIYILR